MDLDAKARVYALELLTTQLISEYLRTVPDPVGQARWARDHLHHAADALQVAAASLDEEARLRVAIKDDLTEILATALARAQTTPLRPRSWDVGPQAG